MEAKPIHALRPAEVYVALQTSPDGLVSADALSRQKLYGLNIPVQPINHFPWIRVLEHTFHPLAVILLLSALIAFILRQPVLSLVIVLLVLVNAAFSFWREHRTEQAMQALSRLLPAYTRLYRDGVKTDLPASEVVPGDVLLLSEGDNIPADARVVEAFGLRTNNAALTGEAMPPLKTADASLLEGISELERPNLVFAGTSVTAGTGKAVVFNTGNLTQFGRIAHLTQSVTDEPSPLQTELKQLSRRISLIAVSIGMVIFVIGITDIGLDKFKAALFSLGILVAAAPEGLPATITLALAMAGQRLAQNKVLVKKLSVIEKLGTVSVILTDKSGTLTQNQLTVREIWVGKKRWSVSGVGYEPKGALTSNHPGAVMEKDMTTLLTAALLCNNARLCPPAPGRLNWSSLGDQTEAALRVVAIKGGMDEQRVAHAFPRLHELPFDARRKRMSTIHSRNGLLPGMHRKSGPAAAFVKGAPREVLQLCSSIQIGDEVCTLTDDLRHEIHQVINQYATRSLRVLALAYRDLPAGNGLFTVESVERQLTFLGLVAMHDPPRPEVADTIQTCLRAGIRMVMITGDYGLTAESLARRLGMLQTPNPLILTGADLDAMDDAQLSDILAKEVIFARMAPEHKLRIVTAMQAMGEIVAVTGDGVNDAPALRRADVGIAMGIAGTDVAREAADIVIINDNFSGILHAIQEGRAVFTNIRKVMTYIFSSNIPEIVPFLLTAILNIPLALTVPQILAIDLGTDLLPALALSAEKPEPDSMRQPPRRKSQHLIDQFLLLRALGLGIIETLLCYSGFILVYFLGGQFPALHFSLVVPWFVRISPEQIQAVAVTMFHAGVVTAQVGNAFACRTETNRGRLLGWTSNPLLLYSIAGELAIILGLIYIPILAQAFDHAWLPIQFWSWLLIYPVVLYSLDWLRKRITMGNVRKRK